MMKLSNSVSGALRTFAYFMSSGTQYTLKGVDYLYLYGNEPSAIEKVYAIFANVIEMDENGNVLNLNYAEKRATDSLRSYCDSSFKVDPPYEDWETALYWISGCLFQYPNYFILNWTKDPTATYKVCP